jgi:hypothetical protein
MKHYLGVCAALLLAACAHDLGLMKKEETLNAYRTAIRWSSFEHAATFQNGAAPASRLSEKFRDIRVTGYDPVAEREDKERLTLHQTVEIRYYHPGDVVERMTLDEQDWHYDADRGKWVIDSPLPHFE